jgi:hypothetical protein
VRASSEAGAGDVEGSCQRAGRALLLQVDAGARAAASTWKRRRHEMSQSC